MNIALYIFDHKKNELKFVVARVDDWDLWKNLGSDYGWIYARSNYNDNTYRIRCKEGKVYYDRLWLFQRNDEKARDLFRNYYFEKKAELDEQIAMMNEKIEKLEIFPVNAYGV